MGLKLMLPEVRGSFLVLGEPEQYQGAGPFRWSATALIPYDSALLQKVRDALKETAKQKWEKKWEIHYEACITDPKACCLVDGKRKDYDGYLGHFALTAHRYQDKGGRPLVMDTDKSPIYKPNNEVYEGKGGRLLGVVVGPMKDVAVITHGPIGCAFYSWGTRRNKAKADAECDDMNFVPYSLCTDMRPTDIVFGGEKKLEKAIDEVMDIFHPKCIMICSTCPMTAITPPSATGPSPPGSCRCLPGWRWHRCC